MHPGNFQSQRTIVLLGLGALAGVALAAVGMLRGGREGGGASLPAGAVARVNDTLILRDDFERTLVGVANDRRDGMDPAQRRQVLDRLIDEELLVQRGLALGLARHDRRVRADVAAAMIASVVAESEDVQPTAAEIEAFYAEQRAFFTQPGRVRLQQVFCQAGVAGDGAAARDRAAEATRRLRAGESLAVVREQLGDPEVSALPDALLPAEKLIDYLGPTVLHAALRLAAGETSDPVRSGTGYHVLQMIARQPDVTPPLAEIREHVVREFRRRAADHALRSYIDDLRQRADVVVDAAIR